MSCLGGLNQLPAEMDLAQFFQQITADFIGPAATDVVGEPVAIAHENKVMCDDDLVAGSVIRRVHATIVTTLREDAKQLR